MRTLIFFSFVYKRYKSVDFLSAINRKCDNCWPAEVPEITLTSVFFGRLMVFAWAWALFTFSFTIAMVSWWFVISISVMRRFLGGRTWKKKEKLSLWIIFSRIVGRKAFRSLKEELGKLLSTFYTEILTKLVGWFTVLFHQ